MRRYKTEFPTEIFLLYLQFVFFSGFLRREKKEDWIKRIKTEERDSRLNKWQKTKAEEAEHIKISKQGTKEEKISTGLVILMLRKYSIFQLFLNCPLTRIKFISGIFAISRSANCDICPLLLSLWTLQRSKLYVKDSPCETILDLARARASKFPNYEIANLMLASRKSKDSIPTLDLSVPPQLCWGCMATFYKKRMLTPKLEVILSPKMFAWQIKPCYCMTIGRYCIQWSGW